MSLIEALERNETKDPRYQVNLDVYEMVSHACWRAGHDDPENMDQDVRFQIAFGYMLKNPPTIKRLSGIEIDAAGLRPYVKDGKVDFEAVHRDRFEYKIPSLDEALRLFAEAHDKYPGRMRKRSGYGYSLEPVSC